MAFDDVYHVTYAGIADFHIVPVKQLVEDVCFREMLINHANERSRNIRLALHNFNFISTAANNTI